MTDKTLKQRVHEEAVHFAEIYADFKQDLLERRGETQNGWEYLFDIPFGYVLPGETPKDKALSTLNIPVRYHAASKAVKQLGLDKLQLGPLSIKDLRVVAALEAGILTPDDIAPPSIEDPVEYARMAARDTTDCTDPIFWRALLEVFCRALISTPGPRPWKLADYIELAFDLDDIRRRSGAWDADDAKNKLRERPYAERYNKENLGIVGENRIRRITALIGPMDDEALAKLKELFPDAFFEVDDRRFRRRMAKRYGTVGILDIGERIGDALAPDDHTDGG